MLFQGAIGWQGVLLNQPTSGRWRNCGAWHINGVDIATELVLWCAHTDRLPQTRVELNGQVWTGVFKVTLHGHLKEPIGWNRDRFLIGGHDLYDDLAALAGSVVALRIRDLVPPVTARTTLWDEEGV